MFKDEEISNKVPNSAGKRLLGFANRIINMDHVSYIDFIIKDQRDDQKKERAIVMHLSSGGDIREDYGHVAHWSHMRSVIEYCLQHDLVSIELILAVHSRVDKEANDYPG